MKNDYLQLKRYIKTIPRYENYEYLRLCGR